MVVGGQCHGLGSSPWERVLVLIELEADWAPEPVWMFWRREKSLPCRDSLDIVPGLSRAIDNREYKRYIRGAGTVVEITSTV
jgi:hypothetical protein